MQYNPTKINFLDTNVIVDVDGQFSIDLFEKPTDRNSLLHYTSCHPSDIKKYIPKSKFFRINRMVSDNSVHNLHIGEIKKKFQDRGYQNFLQSLPSTFTPIQHIDTQRVTFVNTHHPFTGLFIRSFAIIGLYSGTHIPLFLNFRSYLHNAKGIFPVIIVFNALIITNSDSFSHLICGKRFHIRVYYTCNLSCVIYLIYLKCPCGLGYIGETTQHIQDHISQHKSTIRCKRMMLAIPTHFTSLNHNIAKFRYQINENILRESRGENRIQKLKEREASEHDSQSKKWENREDDDEVVDPI
ncbi:unnamed protein product [Ranitomeya imitator]|uniref:Helix-turn-helix domain-containing protein n=1 Tax=Ranitomeya imitator TaxID=111125 RepID=A0ABN9MFE0_9NEOB|nr:unnamed protein product [Ranitomeya imitator]